MQKDLAQQMLETLISGKKRKIEDTENNSSNEPPSKKLRKVFDHYDDTNTGTSATTITPTAKNPESEIPKATDSTAIPEVTNTTTKETTTNGNHTPQTDQSVKNNSPNKSDNSAADTLRGIKVIQALQQNRNQPLFPGVKVSTWEVDGAQNLKQQQLQVTQQNRQPYKNKKDRDWNKMLDVGRLKKVKKNKKSQNSPNLTRKFNQVSDRLRKMREDEAMLPDDEQQE